MAEKRVDENLNFFSIVEVELSAGVQSCPISSCYYFFSDYWKQTLEACTYS